ncbi:MAG: sulfite exporter TauE/SafE family protein [Firmicutes bacterium]|nr:sulfite exporter TauE/SafE family protein [Bacillota bacterium]
MEIFLFIIIGLIGGLIGGMGMGGGTLLIPLLVVFTGTSQHLAQSINLIAFIPMAIVALIIHIKNGLVKFKYLLLISLPAVVLSVLGALISTQMEAVSLKRYFGIFLLILGVYQLICVIINFTKAKKEKKQKELLKKIPPTEPKSVRGNF